MRRSKKTIAAIVLLAMTAAPAGAVTETDASAASDQVASVQSEIRVWCRDVCDPPQAKLAGAGAWVAR